jgi:uncharacterized protein (TIGR00369 family)
MKDSHLIEHEEVPADFQLLPEGLGFTDAIAPCYRKISDNRASFGLLVLPQHANTMGICHGGVVMTLADITAATGVNLARGKKAGSPTINLSVDFISAARQGQWLQADVELVSVKRRFGFCSGVLSTSEGVTGRFNGTFYLPDHKGMWKGEKRGDGVLTGSDE